MSFLLTALHRPTRHTASLKCKTNITLMVCDILVGNLLIFYRQLQVNVFLYSTPLNKLTNMVLYKGNNSDTVNRVCKTHV